MNDTPETDALREAIDNGAATEAEMTSSAGKLERERDELRRMSVTEMMAHNLNVKHHVTEWENRCIKAERERDELREDQSNQEDMLLRYMDEVDEARRLAQWFYTRLKQVCLDHPLEGNVRGILARLEEAVLDDPWLEETK